MVKPERRTRADLLAAAAIAIAIAVVAVLVWWTSDARATISRPAASPVKTPSPAKTVPATLRELWSAPSPKTTLPVVAGGAVVTGDGHEVDGHDPETGAVLWSYARDLDLCGVTSVYSYAVAVYPDSRGCGQVSTIDGQTGMRGPSRTAYADPQVALSTDGTTVLSAGQNRLELWRSDMVRMISYGKLDARIKPDVPGPVLCRLESAAASTAAVSVLEACPDQAGLRLTILRPAKEEDTPDLKYVPLPDVKDNTGARVVAVSDTTTAVYVPTPRPSLMIIDDTGSTTANLPLPKPASPEAAATRPGDLITWWTGDAVMVFSANGMQYRYTIGPAGPHVPIGPATMMAGKLIVPVSDGVGVYDPVTGVNERYIPLRRQASESAVVPGVAGSVLLEQRGPTLVALGG
ncbi:hypothetical protein CQY20_30955 [Mycolicibacterium agri]|uniref:Uncharacterized protein n=1 Tax=Mycolicibacterium agri TaxID=36811 RepID=A0A2A7MNM5_MYCAG|nr:hypothetical protein [Mycolicibacterium agri]PEG33402.1 hypothetical protein CQY20_30955 [Mycolicibacterium agri]GFG51651.1 hypothetical protein MAGR_30920 [Mycolicibacterium agri]